MKRILLTLFCIVNQFANGQVDTIFTKKNKTIICTITQTNSKFIYYQISGKDIEEIDLSKVSSFTQKGKRHETTELTSKDIFPMKDGKIFYTGVVNCDSVNRNELFSRAQEWVAKTYNSGKDVVQLSDKDNGKLIGNGAIEVSWRNMTGFIKYTISIYVKDGKYKFEITNLYHKSSNIDVPDGGACENMIISTDKILWQSRQGEYDNYLSQADDNIKLLIISLNSAMTAKTKKSTDGW